MDVAVKREDLLHPEISGNKWYKLVHHMERALDSNAEGIATFGGAYSNHLLATAAYCAQLSLKSIGFVRGEQTAPLNPTLARCQALGMQLIYLDRSAYRQKTDSSFLAQLSERFPTFHFVPEGGGGRDGMKGAQLMIDDRCKAFDVIVCAVGTGTSAVGIAQACGSHQKVWGIPIHKHITVVEELGRSIPDLAIPPQLHVIRFDHYHFGGYAKWTPELIEFISTAKANLNLPLDPIYTGKAFYALMHEIKNGSLSRGSKVLFIHTGGLQGNAGFEQRFGIELYVSAQKSHKKP